MNKNVKDYAKAEATAKKNWRKYKETNNPKFQNKAELEYGKRDALAILLGKPDNSKRTTNINIGSGNHIKKNKIIKIGIDTKVKNQKTDK